MDPYRTRGRRTIIQAPPWLKANIATGLADSLSPAFDNGLNNRKYPVPYDGRLLGIGYTLSGGGVVTDGVLTVTPWLNGADPGSAYDFVHVHTGIAVISLFMESSIPLVFSANDYFECAVTTTGTWSNTADATLFYLLELYR